MDTKFKPGIDKSSAGKEAPGASMPDEERRKILKKLAACAFVTPAAMVLLEGGDNLTYAGRSGGLENPLYKGISYRPVDESD